MTALFGYAFCLLAILPAFSMDAFFWVIGRSARPHDVLEAFRFALQTLASVTPPFKMGLILAVVAAIFVARRVNPACRLAAAR